jgi:hypothetical protein
VLLLLLLLCLQGEVGFRWTASAKRTFVRVDAILPGHAMGACGWRVLAVLVVLLGHLLQLVFPLPILGVLVLFSFPRRPVFPQVLQLSQHALGMRAPRLDVLEHDGFNLLAHGYELGARGNRGAAPCAVQDLLDGGVAFSEVRAERFVEVGRRRRRLRRRAHVGQWGGIAAPWRGRRLRAGLGLALAADVRGRHGGCWPWSGGCWGMRGRRAVDAGGGSSSAHGRVAGARIRVKGAVARCRCAAVNGDCCGEEM